MRQMNGNDVMSHSGTQPNERKEAAPFTETQDVERVNLSIWKGDVVVCDAGNLRGVRNMEADMARILKPDSEAQNRAGLTYKRVRQGRDGPGGVSYLPTDTKVVSTISKARGSWQPTRCNTGWELEMPASLPFGAGPPT